MKDFPGTPGTLTGLVLRISQFIFAVGSIASMATTSSFFNFTAFCQQGTKLLTLPQEARRGLHFIALQGLIPSPFQYSLMFGVQKKSVAMMFAGQLPAPSPCKRLLHDIRLYVSRFSYLIASMGLLVIWSFVLALLDAYAWMRKKVLHNAILVSLFVVGDWVTSTLSLAAASSSAGITVLYFNDLGHCNFGEECQKYQISVAFAFMSWITILISSLIMLWLLASG